jgi:iron complex outermembrane receptor protein
MNCIKLLARAVTGMGCLLLCTFSHSQNSLSNLDLEELLDMEITSVSKKPQTISKSAAAVFVITAEDIRRMGATSIPDALRIAPGSQVAQSSANSWAVTARGPNGRVANKLLVLIDGRSVFSPITSGVYWEDQDTLLADIERIEVIRGTGAVLWGANAMNGVINIITKSAATTQGGLLEINSGSQERGSISMRYGGKLEDLGYYRLYAKGFDRTGLKLKSTSSTGLDSLEQQRVGGRADLNLSANDALSIQGEIFQGNYGESAKLLNQTQDPFFTVTGINQKAFGGHLLMRWQRELANNNSLTVQSYLDRNTRTLLGHPDLDMNTIDADVQYRHRAYQGHDLLLGVSYRLNRGLISQSSVTLPTGALPFVEIPGGNNIKARNEIWSALVQDDITLLPETLILTLGVKLEKFDSNQPQFFPNTRLLWTPTETHTLWASVGKAIRAPSRMDKDFTFRALAPAGSQIDELTLPLPTFFETSGVTNSETIVSYELGWKHRWTPQLSTDISGFISNYSNLRSGNPQDLICQPSGQVFSAACFYPTLSNYLVLPLNLSNAGSGISKGLEFWADWKPSRQHRLQGSLTLLDMSFSTQNANTISFDNFGASPRWSGSARYSFTPRPDIEFDLTYRQVGELPKLAFGQMVPGYKAADVRWAWRSSPTVQWQVIARNLLTASHQEFISEDGHTSESKLRPSIEFGVSVRF